MMHLSSTPRWWPAALQQGLVQGDAPDLDAGEPSPLVIAMAMLGVLVCVLPIAVFLFFSMSDELLEGMVLGLLLLAGGALLLRLKGQTFASCGALVLWVLGWSLLILGCRGDLIQTRAGALLLLGLLAVALVWGGCLRRTGCRLCWACSGQGRFMPSSWCCKALHRGFW